MKIFISTSRIFIIVTLLINVRCSSPKSGEAKTQDSTAAGVNPDIPTAITQAKAITTAEVTNLKRQLQDRFASQFDSDQYYKVVMQTNYNEYEGQSEAWQAEWYFDKSLSPRGFRELHRSGYGFDASEVEWYFRRAFTADYYKEEQTDRIKFDPDRPDIKEYLITGDSIVYAREEGNYFGKNDGRSVTLWNGLTGGIKSSWSYDSSTVINEPLTENYKSEKRKEWDVYVYSLMNALEKGKVIKEANDTLIIRLLEPKENRDDSDLMDSTRVILPRILYKKLGGR